MTDHAKQQDNHWMNTQAVMNQNPNKRSFEIWPVAIIGFFTIFITSAVAFIVFSLHHKMELVRPDYYEQEIRYQDQIQRLQNARNGERLVMSYESDNRRVKIALPDPALSLPPSGEIQFYRPSNAAWDFHQTLSFNEQGVQYVDLNHLHPGHWKVRIQWESAGKEYFMDESLLIVHRAI